MERRRYRRHRGGFIGTGEGDGFEPGLKKAADGIGMRRDELVGGDNHISMEIRHQTAESLENPGVAALLSFQREAQIQRGAVDLAGLHERDGSGRRAGGHDVDAFWSPPLLPREIDRQQRRERARRGDADFLPFEAGDGRDRLIRVHGDADIVRRTRHRGNRLGRRALDDEGHVRTVVEAHIDAAGDHRLDHLGGAGEGEALDLEAMTTEDPLLDAEIEQGEGKGLRDRLADPEHVFGLSCRGEQKLKQEKENRRGKRRSHPRCAVPHLPPPRYGHWLRQPIPRRFVALNF